MRPRKHDEDEETPLESLRAAPRFLVEKFFDPDGVPAYRGSLPDLASGPDLEVVSRRPDGRIVAVRYLLPDEVEEVLSRPHVRAVEPNRIASVPEPTVEKAASAEASPARPLSPADVLSITGADGAHAAGFRGRGRRIAVLDTGISEATAGELGTRLAGAASFVPGEPAVNAADSHGDWVAQAIAHVCPEAEIVSVKVLSSANGSGPYSAIARGADHAREVGATAANFSLGGPASAILDGAVAALDAAGILAAVAAGNEQRGKPDSDLVADRTSPARCPAALTVAAAGSDLVVADFSNRGACVKVSGPGHRVGAPNVAGYWSGTSMAAPIVLGCAELMASAGLGLAEVKQRLVARARDTAESPVEEGNGFVDVAAALEGLLAPPRAEPPPARMSRSAYARAPIRSLGREILLTYAGKTYARHVPADPYPFPEEG